MKKIRRDKVRVCIVLLGLTALCASCASEPVVKQQERPPSPTVVAPQEPVATIPPVTPAPVALPKVGATDQEPSNALPYFLHTVKWHGETLSLIAAWYTGKSTNWKALAEINPDINPSRIFVGNIIRIPEGLVKTRDPMPKKYVDRSHKSGKNHLPANTAPAEPHEEETPLFGPKASLGK